MTKPHLSVIVPVYNEEKTISEVLKKLLSQRDVGEIVVVDDGSTDASLKEIHKHKDKRVRVFSKENNGKGSAIRFGLMQVRGEYVLIQDADLEYDPEDIPALLEPVHKGKAEVIYGSRFLGPHLNLLYWHRVGNSVLNFLVNILYNTTLSDMETCYKLLPAKLMKELDIRSNNFDIEPEITCKVLKRGIAIYEVPISYVGRTHAEGKKITWRAGLTALTTIFSIRIR